MALSILFNCRFILIIKKDMFQRIPDAALLRSEIKFATSRSSGPGGQNVNKVNSKVTLEFDVANSSILTDEEKNVIQTKLATVLTKEGKLMLTAQTSRSQLDNKEEVLRKFDKALAKAFFKRKTRKATKPGKAAVRKRLSGKKHHSEKKKSRRGPEL